MDIDIIDKFHGFVGDDTFNKFIFKLNLTNHVVFWQERLIDKFNKEYNLINPLIGDSLKGHTLIRLK